MAGIPVEVAFLIYEPKSTLDEKLSPVIFLHGMTSKKETWCDIPQIVADTTKRKVYALDARNHGESPCGVAFSFDLNVTDLFHFMDSNNIPKAIIVGHSMGGVTSIRAALQKPERIEKVVIEDMNVRKAPKAAVDQVLMYFIAVQKALKVCPKELDKDEAVKFMLCQVEKEIPEELKKHFESRKRHSDTIDLKRNPDGTYSLNADMDAIINTLKNYDTLASEPEGRYDGPACFIYGKDSPNPIVQDEAYIKEFFPKAELVCIENAAHTVHTDNKKDFVDALLAFLCKES